MTTENNNHLIAEFLGWDFLNDMTYSKVTKSKWVEIEKLKFHSDWNWLMEVVEKIESLDFDFTIYTGACISIINTKDFPFEEIITSGGQFKNKIETVYNGCVEFIKWYNENSAKENETEK